MRVLNHTGNQIRSIMILSTLVTTCAFLLEITPAYASNTLKKNDSSAAPKKTTTPRNQVKGKSVSRAKPAPKKKLTQLKTSSVSKTTPAPVLASSQSPSPVPQPSPSIAPVSSLMSAPATPATNKQVQSEVSSSQNQNSTSPAKVLGFEVGGSLSKASVSGANQSSASSDVSTSGTMRARFDLPIPNNKLFRDDRWMIQFTGSYTGRNATSNTLDQSFKTKWIEISPSLTYWIIPKKLYAGFGPYFALPVGDVTREHTSTGIRTSSQSVNSIFRPDFGLSLSVGSQARINSSTLLLIGTRYNHGLLNVVDSSAANSIPGLGLSGLKVREIQFLAGVGFELF